MQPIIVLYGRQLTSEKLAQFIEQTEAQLLKQADYLDYHLAFFKAKLTACLKVQAQALGCDIAELKALPTLKEPGLLVMDMDSTAIKIECIDEIAKLAGTGEQVSAITASAMRGELDFEQSLRQRVATLKDAPETILQKVRQNLPLMEGFETLIQTLKQAGWRVAIASGGFDYFADYLKAQYGLDDAVANRLEVINGKLTGEVLGQVVDAAFKATTLVQLAEKYHIPAHQWVAVGDGANDLLMLKKARLGVALHAKPKVQAEAEFVVNFGDLTALLLLLNIQTIFNEE